MQKKFANIYMHSLLWVTFILFLAAGIKGYSPDWNHSFNPIGSYWGGDPDKNPFLLKTFSVLTAFLSVTYMAVASLIGSSTLLSLFPRSRQLLVIFGLPSFLLIGYPFGVLGIIAINRIVTLIAPNIIALKLTITLLIFFSFVSFLVIKKSEKLLPFLATRIVSSWYFFVALVFLFIFLIFQLHFPDAHILGDGARFTLKLIEKKEVLGINGRIPLIDQHYDELLFLYPLFLKVNLTTSDTSEILQIFWFHYAFTKTSSFLLMIGVGVLVGVSVKKSFLIVFLCFFGSVFIAPLEHALIFDSGGPIAYSLHSGRVLVSILLITFLALSFKGFLNERLGKKQALLILLFSLGLGGLTISSISIILVMIIGFFLSAIQLSARSKPILILVAIYGFLLAALSLGSDNKWGAWVLPAILLISGALILRYSNIWRVLIACKSFEKKLSTVIEFFGSLMTKGGATVILTLFGYFIALILLGNIFIKDYSWISTIGQSIEYRGVGSPKFGIGLNPFCGKYPHGYCANFFNFINAFGFPILALIIVGFLLNRSRSYRLGHGIIEAALISVFLYIGSIWIFVFFNSGAISDLDFWMIWFKSRLIEPFFYSSIFFLLAAACMIRPQCATSLNVSPNFFSRLNNYVIYFIAVYIVSGIIVDNTPKIILSNLMYLKSINVEFY
jgi:hypothetical protein